MPFGLKLRFFTDGARHLVCYPFSLDGLHEMARNLGIKRCWFHANRLPHYDVPKLRVGSLPERVEVITSRQLLAIIKGSLPPDPTKKPSVGKDQT